MSHPFLTHLGKGYYTPVVTVPLILEYEKTLLNPLVGIPLPKSDILKFVDYICSESIHQKLHFLWRPFLRDPNGDMVLEAAVNGQCKYIITFNKKDFQGVEKFGLKVATPLEFMKRKGIKP